jgi:uncharacterized RDD family membrane protein YckC
MTERVVDAVDPDMVLGHVDMDAVVDRIDVNRLLDRIDPNRVLDRVDVHPLLDRVDINRLLARVDVDALLRDVDLDAVVGGLDLDLLLDRMDPNLLLDRVEPDRLLDRMDPNRLLDRLEPDRLLDRIEINRLLDRVDVNALLRDVDLEALVSRSGLPEVVAASTTQVAGSTLDLARRQVAGLDFIVDHSVDRLVRRAPETRPEAPPLLAESATEPGSGERREITGHYAGAVGRAAAFLIDSALVTAGFTATVTVLDRLVGTVYGGTASDRVPGWLGFTTFLLWAFLYMLVCLVIAGRTPGKALVGLRVVLRDGSTLGPRSAFLRTVAYPFSFLLAGLGLVPVVLAREHRALHDVVAGTAVVFDFGDRPAELPGPLSRFLDRAHQ